jgi:quercetin dioxygenase-like cupin family protein
MGADGQVARYQTAFFKGVAMALPQDISPVNSEAMESLVRTNQMNWVAQSFDPERSFMKVLWTGPESGRVALLFRCLKGAVVPAHKHIGDAHTFVLKGKLEVRGTTIGPGDYLYEANGMVHHSTKALEDTEYLFIMQGAVLFFDDKQFLGYQGWEEFHRVREQQLAAG